MAKALIPRLVLIFSVVGFLLITLHFEQVVSFEDDDQDDENISEEYTLDDDVPVSTTAAPNVRASRFLSSSSKKPKKINVGCSCNAKSKKTNVCNGVWANNKKSHLYCCSKHCADVLNDHNNCGRCGRRCWYGQKCCNGVCRNIWFDKNNCGKCNKKCRRHVRCEYGYCGYA